MMNPARPEYTGRPSGIAIGSNKFHADLRFELALLRSQTVLMLQADRIKDKLSAAWLGYFEYMEKKVKLAEQKADLAYLKSVKRNLDSDKSNLSESRDSLAERLRAGDRTAAAELVDAYYEQIYLFMRRFGHDRQVSEDLTQECFFNAWHHIGQLKDGKALNGWIYRIASNVSKLHWRRHKHKEVIGIEGLEMPHEGMGESEKIEHNERLERLKDAVERLPFKLRETIILHYIQQLTIAEATEAAGLNQGTFKSRLNRALKTLRKEMI